MKPQIPIDHQKIKDFCRKWKIAEFSLFGSVLRDDFRPDSDVDILVSFLPDSGWSLYDWIDMTDELRTLFGRRVDLVSQSGLRNPYRRREIMAQREVLYAER